MPTDSKKRPRFSAPKPPVPAPALEIVANDKADAPKNVVEAVVEPPHKEKVDEPANDQAPTPPGPKTVSRNRSAQDPSPLDEVLSETTTTSTPPLPEKEVQMPDKPVAQPKMKPNPIPVEMVDSGSFSPNPLLVGITVFSLVLAVAGWGLYFQTGQAVSLPSLSLPSFSSSTPTPTPQPSIAPTPTPNPRKSITLEVLNGSGVAGQAGETAASLEKLGYSVIKTGNADNQKYSESEVYLVPNFSKTDLLLKDLNTFGPATKSGDLNDSTASARIIIGQDWTE